MVEATEAGKVGRPALGMFTMYSWRGPVVQHLSGKFDNFAPSTGSERRHHWIACVG
jgi:hypothetical protein